jgi:hypothetical protein
MLEMKRKESKNNKEDLLIQKKVRDKDEKINIRNYLP